MRDEPTRSRRRGVAVPLEYNADTPTGLLESAICQWYRLQDTRPAGLDAVAPPIEPIGKMLLSNKALPAVLWELFPDRPNLLPAYFDGPVTDYFARFVPHVIEG